MRNATDDDRLKSQIFRQNYKFKIYDVTMSDLLLFKNELEL